LIDFCSDVHNVDEARFLFSQLDMDHDGLLSQEELRRSNTKFSAKEIEVVP
jgi:Ca2+-binding EF-hand superfamily protein